MKLSYLPFIIFFGKIFFLGLVPTIEASKGKKGKCETFSTDQTEKGAEFAKTALKLARSGKINKALEFLGNAQNYYAQRGAIQNLKLLTSTREFSSDAQTKGFAQVLELLHKPFGICYQEDFRGQRVSTSTVVNPFIVVHANGHSEEINKRGKLKKSFSAFAHSSPHIHVGNGKSLRHTIVFFKDTD